MPGPTDTDEPTEDRRPVGAGRPGGRVLEREVDAEVSDLLARILAQEQVDGAARSDLEEFFGWPSWSMDTGLTPAQERFARSGRHLTWLTTVRGLHGRATG